MFYLSLACYSFEHDDIFELDLCIFWEYKTEVKGVSYLLALEQGVILKE